MKTLRHSILALSAILLLTACGKDGGGSGSDIIGWYIEEDAPTASDLKITDPELLQDIANGTDYIFTEAGRMIQFRKDNNATSSPSFQSYIVHIVSDKVLEFYQNNSDGDACYIWKVGSSGTVGRTQLYKIDGGVLGPLAYYGVCYTYTYTRDDDILTITHGKEAETFIVSKPNGLTLTGYPGKFKKYDPNKTY